MQRLRLFYAQHQDFLLLWWLFITFRFLAMLLFRPGGYFAPDLGDVFIYREHAALTSFGYYPHIDFWSAYPPPFPWLSLLLYRVSLFIPAWEKVPAVFTYQVLLGSIMVLAEAGNLFLLYRLALRFYDIPSSLRVAWIYALLFMPVFVMIGYFDSLAIFLMLVGLYGLVTQHAGLAGLATGLGATLKIFPGILVPVAMKALSWRDRLVFGVLASLLIAAILLPFLLFNPPIFLATLQGMLQRMPWETVWAILEGHFGWGIPGGGNRFDPATAGVNWYQPRLPTRLISLAFAAFYLWLFTRRLDTQDPRRIVAFSGLSLVIFGLYLKGYSPQFLTWYLPFVVLLLPNLRGAGYAVAMTLLNVAEYPFYLYALIDSHWLLTGIVILRALFFVGLALEFAWIAYDWSVSPTVYRRSYAGLMLAFGLASVVGLAGMARDYAHLSYKTSPYRPAIDYLRAHAAPQAGLLFTDLEAYERVFPFLYNRLPLHVIDTWHERPPWQPRVDTVADRYPDLWVCSRERGAIEEHLATRRHRVSAWRLGACEMSHFLADPLAATIRPGNWQLGEGIRLIGYRITPEEVLQPGDSMEIVLFWQVDQPVARRYTVFTHLLDPNSQIQGQLDAEPCGGACATPTWRTGDMIEDVYRFPVAPEAEAGTYSIEIGMYDTETIVRLPILDAAGQRLPDDRILLGPFTLQKP